MIPFNQDATGGTELSPKQMHTICQTQAGLIEFNIPKTITEDELMAIERIKQILDKLQFDSQY